MNQSSRLRLPALPLIAGLLVLLSGCGTTGKPVSSHPPNPSPKHVAVQGTVLDEQGQPVSGALAVPESKGRNPFPIPEIAVYTNEQGVFVWHLPPGPYDFVITKEGYETARHPVNVPKGKSEYRFKMAIHKKR